MDKDELCTLLATLAGVLNSLKLLEVRTSGEELESIVMRAFLEAHLDYRKGMTTYEVTGVYHISSTLFEIVSQLLLIERTINICLSY